jgi:type I restriction enzyme S subunit
LEEQVLIAASLDATRARLVAAGGRASKEIELLREYRTRLIADVVTGKLDVREAAARLPVESDEPEEAAADEALSSDGADAKPAEEAVEEPGAEDL